MGGISNWKDAIEFILASATAVQLVPNFIDPTVSVKVVGVLSIWTDTICGRFLNSSGNSKREFIFSICILISFIFYIFEMILIFNNHFGSNSQLF